MKTVPCLGIYIINVLTYPFASWPPQKICLDKIIEYHLFIAEMKNSSDQVYLPFIKWETGIFLYCCGLMEGAAASHRKIFSGLQNWAQDQHIEYAWLSFHPSALIQYSQRLMQKKKKASWHWPRWLLGHLSFSIISKSKKFANYHLMYLATVNGKVQHICTLALLNLNQSREVNFQITCTE